MPLPVTQDALRKGLTATYQRVRSSAGSADAMYLRLPKTGEWVYGPDEMPVQEGSLWAVDPTRFMQGYISWETDESKPAAKLGEHMVNATDPPLDVTKLEDTGCPWVEQLAMQMLCLNGEDKGTALIYNTTSVGGKRAVNQLIGAVAEQLAEGSGDDIIPVIELEVDSYQHKRYGKIYTPVFSIKRWVSFDSTPQAEEAAAEAEPAAEAETPDATSSKPAQESEPEAKPQRQRRRRRPVAA